MACSSSSVRRSTRGDRASSFRRSVARSRSRVERSPHRHARYIFASTLAQFIGALGLVRHGDFALAAGAAMDTLR
jgi:hypothetical protein